MTITELQAGAVVIQDGGMTRHYLSKKQFAARIGIKEGAEGALDNLQLPRPDVVIGEGPRATRGWSEKTIDEWNASRPGRGRSWAQTPAKKR